MVQVIFSDVDGTLLNSRHQLTPLNRTVIQAVQRQGVPFCHCFRPQPLGRSHNPSGERAALPSGVLQRRPYAG